MKEKITQVLKSYLKSNNETFQRLKELLNEVQEDKQQILTMLMDFYKDDIKKGNNLLEELFKNTKTKYQLAPDLSHLLITKKLYFEIFGEVNQDDQYALEIIKSFTKIHYPNLLAIVQKSLDELGQQIDDTDKTQWINLLKQYLLNDIQNDQKSSNLNKNQLNAVLLANKKQEMDALTKSLDNARKDIQEMNCKTIKQYYFVSAEIQWIQQQLQNKNQIYTPQKFPRTSQLIKLIQSRKQFDPEVIKAFDEMKSGKDVKRNILVLKKRICGIDFNELFRMLAEARGFQKQQMQTMEKHNRNRKEIKAVSFFGLSKVGKSTLIKSLMGYKMKMTKIDGINTIQVQDPSLIKPEHQSLKIGASNKSTTRIPRLYLLPKQSSKKKILSKGDIYLFDCPGAEDSESIEVEISNRITTIEALKQVGELFIAIVLSEKIQGLNGEGYEKLARAVDGFVKNYKDIKQSIMLIFNGGSEEYLDTFCDNIQDIRNNIQKRNNYTLTKNLKEFFDHLKNQSQNRQKMFVVNPLKLKVEDFLEQIPAKGIQNCENVLDGRLGERCNKQIEQSVQKLKLGFNECFENDDIDGASYYFAILQKIASEDKISLYGNREIKSIEKQMMIRVNDNISDFKKEIENLRILRMKKQDREIEMQKLKAKYEKIKKNLKKISTIKVKSSENKQLYEELHQKLSDIIQDTETWFLNQMKKWKSQNFDLKEVSEITEVFMEFLTCFQLSKKQFDKSIEQIKGEILSEMKEHFQNRENNHKMKQNLTKLTSIHKLINPKFTIPLVDQIQEKFKILKEPISIIKWDYLNEPKKMEGDAITFKGKIKTEYENEQEVKKINQLLNFILLMKGYPKEMKEKLEGEMEKVQSYLSKEIPEFFITKLDDIIADDQLMDKSQQDNIKIASIQGIIKNLKFLDSIEAIKNYQKDKISLSFNKLEEFIEKNIQKIQQIKEAFKKDNIDELKRDLEKVILDMKRLKNMVLATGKEELNQKRDELEKSFYREIDTFISRNRFGQRLVLQKSELVPKSFLKLNKLIEFRAIFKVLDEITNKLLDSTIQEGQKRIIEPISNYSQQLTESKTFTCSKLNHCFTYYEACKKQCETTEKNDIIHKLEDQMKKLIKNILNIYQNTVLTPVNRLKQKLLIYKKRSIKNEEQMNQRLFELDKQINEYKKALKKLKQMEILKYQELDIDYLSLQNEIEEAFKDFVAYQIAKIKENQGLSALNELEKNVETLKEMERSYLSNTSAQKQNDEFQFQKLLDNIRLQKTNFNETQKSHLQTFQKIQKIEDIKNFHSSAFIKAYKEFQKDKSNVSNSNMRKLKLCLQTYLNLANQKIQQLNSEVEGSSLDLDLEHQNYYFDSLKFIILITQNFEQINLRIPDLKKQYEQNYKKYSIISKECIDKTVQKLTQFCPEIEKEIDRLKNQEIKKIKNFFNIINQNMVKIEKFQNSDILLQTYGDFIKGKNVKSLSEIIQKMVSGKKQKIQTFIQGKQILILQNVDSNFNTIYNSLDQKQISSKQALKKKIKSQISFKKQELKKLMGSNFVKFQEQFNSFCQKIQNLPQQLSKQFSKDIQMLETFVKQKENSMKLQIDSCKIDKDLKQAIKIAKRIDELENPKFGEQFVKYIQKSMKKPKPQKGFFYYLKYEIWENNQNRDNLKSFKMERLNDIFKSYQQKLTEEAKKQLQQKWASVDKHLFSVQNNDGRMSSRQSIIQTSSQIQSCRIESCIEYIKDSYHSLCKQITNGNNYHIYETINKITEDKINSVMEQMKKVIQQIENNKNYDFLTEDKCQKFSRLKEILKMMTTKTNCLLFQTKFAKQIQELLINQQMLLSNNSNTVQQCLNTNYEFYNEKLKNLTDQQIEKYVQKISSDFCYLNSIQNSYNKYFKLNSNKIIRIEQVIKNFQEQMNKAEKEHQQSLITIFDNLDQSVNGIIGFIPKIFDKLSSIKKKPLSNIQKQIIDQQRTINSKISNKISQQKAEIKKCTDELLSSYEKQLDNYQKISSKLKRQKQQELRQVNKNFQKNKATIESKFQITNNSQQEKENLENQRQAELKNNENNKRQKENQASQRQNKELNKYFQKQDQQMAQKYQNMAINLIKGKKMQYINEMAHKQIEKSLEDSCKKIIKDFKLGQKFFFVLNNLGNNFAFILIAERNQFAKFRNSQFQQLTEKTNNLKQIIDEMFEDRNITKAQVDVLSQQYRRFDKIQKQHIENYQRTKQSKIVSKLSFSIQERGRKLKELIQKSQFIQNQNKVQLLAEIFALWSISNAEKEKSSDGSIFICFRAHAAQVICILILIAIESDQIKGQIINKNRLAEVKTGQGKSIVLAMLSIYFALCGYEVDCICYSSILSKRDQSDFEDLFKHCGVESKINYGVFQVAIRKILNQQDGENKDDLTFQQFVLKSITSNISISEMFMALIDKLPILGKYFKRFRQSFEKKRQNKILIIDEIDVLFNKKYFGDTFNLSIDLRDESIVALLQFIWKRKNNITAKIVLSSSEFKAVTNKFSALTSVLQNQVYGMILALKTYKEQQNYVIKDQTIYYKVEDKYSSDVSYRYNTTYLYLQQFEKNRVSQSALMKNMVINLCVAEFSYACILEYYTHILGVTGTLTCLPEYIKEFMQDKFKILKEEQKYVIPSVYGKNMGKKICSPICTSREGYHDAIIKNIKEIFEVDKKPILVFFKSKTELINFYNSQKYINWQKYTFFFTEEHSEKERNDRIYRCSFKNSITLMTETFIRGTDFKLIDKSSEKAGGFHAIVTYLIDNTADYIQAMGRVGRQGKPGSFIEIFMKDDLQFLGLKASQEQISKISAAREKKQESEKQSILERIKVSKKKNDETKGVFQDTNFTLSKLVDYIKKNNFFPEVTFSDSKIKMLLLIDATVSMSNLFVQLKLILPQIFDDVYTTLEKKNVKGCLQLQILQYRNYNSPAQNLLQCSNLEIQAENLKKFIDKSGVSGGWGNQAIQVALQYVNSLKEVNQIFIIGDARGNTKEEVTQKRNTSKSYEKARLQKGYTPTTTEEQLSLLVRKKISINTFCLSGGESVKQYFKNLSDSTNGKYQQISLYQKASSMLITKTIVQRVLSIIGQENGGSNVSNALLQEYQKILNKRMNK